jgi:hypothetical protein
MRPVRMPEPEISVAFTTLHVKNRTTAETKTILFSSAFMGDRHRFLIVLQSGFPAAGEVRPFP